MHWKRTHTEERGKDWTDWVSEDGAWMAAEGYDETARKAGHPWSLFLRVDGRWRWMGTHKSLADAKSQAVVPGSSPAQQESAPVRWRCREPA